MIVLTKDFNVAVNNAAKAISKDKYRPVFCKIHLFTKENMLFIEAVDGFRVHKSCIIATKEDNEPDFDVLVETLEPIKEKVDVISISVEDGKLRVFNVEYKIWTEGEYINTDEVIPKCSDDGHLTIRFNAKYLYEALKCISNNGKNERPIVDLYFCEDFKNGGINPYSPVVLKSGNQTNVVLPVRKNW